MLNKYYEDYFEMFATDGWKTFMEECQASLDENELISNCPDKDEFLKRKGVVSAYSRIINLETYIRAAHEQMIDENTV